MRAAVYLRISQDREGRRLGVDRQREHCEELARRLGAHIVEVFCDNDKSASTLSRKRRPDFETMTARAERGDFDAILSYSTSRLTRRPMEIERLIPLGERYRVKIHTVKHGDYDLNSARGRRRAREDAARDAEEVEESAERIRDEVLQRAAQSRYHGGPRAYGFNGADVVEEEANLIRHWAELLLAGGSLRGIAAELNRDGTPSPGGSAWRAWVIRRILLNPRVGGLRILHGTEYAAPNDPILLTDVWRAVVRLLTEPERGTGRSRPARKHLGTGLFVCERCERTVNSAYDARKNLLYKCLHCYRSWRADVLNQWLDDVIAKRFGRADVADLLPRASNVDTEALRIEAKGVRARLVQLAEEFADDTLTGEQLRVATGRLRGRLAEIEAALGDAGRAGPLAPIVLSDDPVAAWRALDDLDRRRAVVRSLMTVVLGPPIRGRIAWDPRKFLGGSRWTGDTRTWGEHWESAS